MPYRELQQTLESVPTSDGAGVKLRRSIGATPARRLDPFLMLDEFFSDNPDDYLAGFPPHPHRGFETVTYMLDGHMQHRDHLGNTGDLGPGSVQWMTAARGIIHSEMPQQQDGRMRGFQLWLNLPASEKMQPASYRDIPAEQVPIIELDGDGSIRVIAGQLSLDGRTVTGAVDDRPTQPLYLDLRLPAGQAVDLPVPRGLSAFVYAYEGSPRIGERELATRSAGVLSDGDSVRLDSGDRPLGALLLAGKPLREPVVQYGPFVMNTQEEIEQALRDYRDGTLAA